MHLDEVGRERGHRRERDPRPDEAGGERVEAQQPEPAEDRWREEHEAVAAEPAGLGEQRGQQVRELEVEAAAAAVEHRGRRVPQPGGLRERADPGVELEVVVRRHPSGGHHVATRIAIEQDVLGVMPDGERGRPGGDGDREGGRHLRVAVSNPRDPPRGDGSEQCGRGHGAGHEGRHGGERAGDRECQPDRAEADEGGQRADQGDHEPRRQGLGDGDRSRSRSRRPTGESSRAPRPSSNGQLRTRAEPISPCGRVLAYPCRCLARERPPRETQWVSE